MFIVFSRSPPLPPLHCCELIFFFKSVFFFLMGIFFFQRWRGRRHGLHRPGSWWWLGPSQQTCWTRFGQSFGNQSGYCSWRIHHLQCGWKCRFILGYAWWRSELSCGHELQNQTPQGFFFFLKRGHFFFVFFRFGGGMRYSVAAHLLLFLFTQERNGCSVMFCCGFVFQFVY